MILPFVSCLLIFLSSCSAPQKSELTIRISTESNTVSINNKPVIYQYDSVIALLGQPSKVEKVITKQRYEEYGGPNGKTSTEIEVDDYLMIYDELGLVFRTRNLSSSRAKDPMLLYIFTGNERTMERKNICERVPSKKFAGTVIINDSTVPFDRSFIPDNIDYTKNRFSLFDIEASTSYNSSQPQAVLFLGSPFIAIYFNNPADRKASIIGVEKPVK